MVKNTGEQILTYKKVPGPIEACSLARPAGFCQRFAAVVGAAITLLDLIFSLRFTRGERSGVGTRTRGRNVDDLVYFSPDAEATRTSAIKIEPCDHSIVTLHRLWSSIIAP